MKNFLFALFIMPALLIACSDDDDEGPVDAQKVKIENLAHSPQSPSADDEVTVSATVTTDEGSTLTSVTLEYAKDGESTPASVTMTNEGSVYSGTIPAQDAGVTVNYKVVAKNNKNDQKEASGSFTVYSEEVATSGAIFINECDPNDKRWEIYNAESEPVNVGGWTMVKDYDMDRVFTFPEPTIIPAHGFLVLKQDEEGSPVFGMSATKGFRYDLSDKDGNLADVFDNFEAMQINDNIGIGQSLGRVGDGGSVIATFTNSSIGETNDNGVLAAAPVICKPAVSPVLPAIGEKVSFSVNLSYSEIINEVKLFYSLNDQDEQEMDMDADDNGVTWSVTIPGMSVAGTVVFRLEATPGGEITSPLFSYTIADATVDYSFLVLNEIDGNSKSVELYNSGAEAIPLVGVTLSKNDGSWWTGTAESGSIDPDGYVVITQNGPTPGLSGSSGISPKQNLKFELKDPDGNSLGTFLRGDENNLGAGISDVAPKSFQRCPNGTGEWKLADPTNGAENPDTGDDIPQS